ncbi:glycoside hydrolase N-terminal domain-containing protein, partial [Streptomyces sp. NPDC059409]|uniref:glycoside hydrolase N-terminal domain-containing protein n=1 Tax=Streptomyces sp. NPDC059409 TaxID=3346824 RepID=UPI003682C398
MSATPVHGTWEPEPADRWEDAFLTGNGQHGALVHGDPDADRVIVTHHTLVRPDGDDEHRRPPALAARRPPPPGPPPPDEPSKLPAHSPISRCFG